MEEKPLQTMYDKLFYRAAAAACYKADSAEIERDAASPAFQPYSQSRYHEGLCALKQRCSALHVKHCVPVVKAAPSQRKNRPGTLFRRPLRMLTAAALVMCLLIGTAMAAGGVFDRFALTDCGEYSVVTVGSSVPISASWQAACYPTWIPDGFVPDEADKTELSGHLSYKNSCGDCLNFQIIPQEDNLSSTIFNTINTENSDAIKVFIHGNPATIYVRHDFYAALCYFSYEGTGYIIGGNVTADDIVTMVERLSIFER